MNTGFSSMIKQFITFIIVVCIAYILNSILYFILPTQSIEFTNKQNETILDYRKFNIKTALKETKIVIQKQIIKVKKQEYQLLSDIQLKAVYFMRENKGWIILEDKSKNTHMLAVGETFKGYELVRIYINYVIFDKNSKEYKVALKSDDKINYSISKTTNTKDQIKPIDDVNIIVFDNQVSVQRAYLNSYINNFDSIWKDISIKETKNNSGQISGFKVTSVKKRSVFDKLGLKTNDIIKSINNIELKSYNDAFSIYKKINKINNLKIVILRNGKEMELEYEIK